MKQEVTNTLGKIIGNRVENLLKEHTGAIIKRLDEEFKESGNMRTRLSIPISVVITREGNEFQIESSLELAKRIKEIYSVDQVRFNPNQPDLFSGMELIIGDDPVKDNAIEKTIALVNQFRQQEQDEACGYKIMFPVTGTAISTGSTLIAKTPLKCTAHRCSQGDACKPEICGKKCINGVMVCLSSGTHNGPYIFHTMTT